METFEINFNTKHLTKGDPLPPWNGKLRVYNMRVCPFAQRTILALNAKQLDFEVINVDLIDKPEWFTSKSGFGKVPAIEIEEGVCIYESLVTVEYLEDAFPQRPLFPKDPVKKAFDKIIVEASGPIQTLYFKLMRFPETINDETLSGYEKALNFIQDQLRDRGTTFLDGPNPGYVDYMLWPWFERIQTLDDAEAKIDPTKYSLLLEYFENMYKDPAVSVYLLPDRVWDKFHQGYKSGTFKVQSIEDDINENQ